MSWGCHCLCVGQYQYSNSVSINLNLLLWPSAEFVFKWSLCEMWEDGMQPAAELHVRVLFLLNMDENLAKCWNHFFHKAWLPNSISSYSNTGRSARITWRVGSLWTLCHPSRWTTSSWWWTVLTLRCTEQPGHCASSASQKSWACFDCFACPDSSATSTSGRRWETETKKQSWREKDICVKAVVQNSFL